MFSLAVLPNVDAEAAHPPEGFAQVACFPDDARPQPTAGIISLPTGRLPDCTLRDMRDIFMRGRTKQERLIRPAKKSRITASGVGTQ